MISKALIAASTKPIILAILSRSENYGYQIIQKVKIISNGSLEWSDGMLYPVLHRLEKDGYIISQWKVSKEGRHRKYYRLTDMGREELETEKRQWISVHSALSKLWKPFPA
ncbi:MAG: helix-turn-helix transcriptional regulator [Candidatus Aminicenantes bacterium]|nr:helix-turn-helix transcriptional regulator [Candidatus Aminicenantes bacterium]